MFFIVVVFFFFFFGGGGGCFVFCLRLLVLYIVGSDETTDTDYILYNNNRLFMAPHLIIVQSTYKNIRIHSFHHTHTHTHTQYVGSSIYFYSRFGAKSSLVQSLLH